MKHFPTSKAINIQGDTSRWALGSVAINLGSSPACGPLLQLATAQADQGNSQNWLQQNLGPNVMCHPVCTHKIRSFNSYFLVDSCSTASACAWHELHLSGTSFLRNLWYRILHTMHRWVAHAGRRRQRYHRRHGRRQATVRYGVNNYGMAFLV